MAFIQQIDQELFLFLNSLHCQFMDSVMFHISGKKEWIPFYVLIIFFIVRKRNWDFWVSLAAIALMIVLSDQISGLIKDTVQRLRPSHNPAIAGLVHTVSDYRGGRFGFVSSHAANAFAVAAFVSMFFARRWLTVLMLCWAFLVSYSRIYLGVHYPLDILCGGVIGYAIGLGMFYLESWVQVKVQRWKLKKFDGN